METRNRVIRRDVQRWSEVSFHTILLRCLPLPFSNRAFSMSATVELEFWFFFSKFEIFCNFKKGDTVCIGELNDIFRHFLFFIGLSRWFYGVLGLNLACTLSRCIVLSLSALSAFCHFLKFCSDIFYRLFLVIGHLESVMTVCYHVLHIMFYGSSSTVQTMDNLNILPANQKNPQKMFFGFRSQEKGSTKRCLVSISKHFSNQMIK